jgi:undecaprenyl-diphosphatase
MNLFESIILGIVQGLTEFLPISSSGHLVFVEKILDVETHNLVFEVLVHVGTLLAVVIYYRRRLSDMIVAIWRALSKTQKTEADNKNLRLAIYLIVGTIPAVIFGFTLKDLIEKAFDSPKWVSFEFLITAVILISTHWAKDLGKPIDFTKSIWIGIAQAISIMPAISRSGATIATGLFAGMKKEEAADFSFLLSIPAIAGAAVLDIPDFLKDLGNRELMTNYFIGAIIAGIIGYFSIAVLLKIVKTGKFFYFGAYCALIGILGLLFL